MWSKVLSPIFKNFVKFQTKVFLAIFFSTFIVGSGVLWLFQARVKATTETEFANRYQIQSRLIGKMLVQFEKNAEDVMLNAAYNVRTLDDRKGVLTTSELVSVAALTKVTHFFEVNSQGNFIRSTNEDPNLIPNIFSFCQNYRKMFSGELSVEATPILPPRPEVNPYKFLTIANSDRTRLIHVGLRVDFIAELLKQALDEDKNIQQINLFAPDGTSLGNFGRESIKYVRDRNPSIQSTLSGVKETSSTIEVFEWITSAHPICCQCLASGNTRNGVYDYLLSTSISKAPLEAGFRLLLLWFFVGELLVLAASLILAKILSLKIVSRLNDLNDQIKAKTQAESELSSLQIDGRDEVSQLGTSFNGLLTKLLQSQNQILDFEKKKHLANLAAQVAHDIVTPISILIDIIENNSESTYQERELLLEELSRMKALAEKMLRQYKGEQIQVEKEKFNLTSLVKVISTEGKALARTKCKVTTDISNIPIDLPPKKRTLFRTKNV